MRFVGVLLLAGLTLLAVSLQKTYRSLPPKELKRRAAKGDEVAKLLNGVVAYGVSLHTLLWAIIGLSAGGFFVLFSRSVPSWLALMGSVALLWLGFAWLPVTRVTAVSQWLARTVTPVIEWLLNLLHPLLIRVDKFMRTDGRVTVHTGLYQKEDLIALLDRQNGQLDNRITVDELALARQALKFEERVVRDIMTPRRVIKMVDSKESVGPLLLDDLHRSGFSRFPVFEKKDEIVGTLYLRRLVEKKATGKVRDLMDKKVFYVNEGQPLGHVLNAFIKTKHHLFMVVNEFEEISGVISIEDVLEQLIGRQIVDEFDKYDDLREVAAIAAKKDKQSHTHAVSEPEAEHVEKPE